MSLSVVEILARAVDATESEESPKFNVSETFESALLSLRSTVAIEK